MSEYNAESILDNLEQEIKLGKLTHPQPVAGDKWLLASAMQKAIRRGEVERAASVAASLWYQDRMSFWRRLHVVAIEDVGVASPDMVVKVLTATAFATWRRRVGDLRVGLFLVRLLCKSSKTRIADELLLQAERSGSHKQLRAHFANSSDSLLTDYVLDENCSLVERALALWYLAGTRKFPTELMPQRKGSPDKAVELLRALVAPADLVESCLAVISRTQYPLAMFTPLAWQEVQKQSGKEIISNRLASSPDIDGLPYYAADVYTRVGQTCFRHLQKTLPELMGYSVRQIGVAVFYLEGGLLDKVLTSPFLDEFSKAGEIADAEGAGLDLPDYMSLRECLSQHQHLLQNIRSEQLQRYLHGAA